MRAAEIQFLSKQNLFHFSFGCVCRARFSLFLVFFLILNALVEIEIEYNKPNYYKSSTILMVNFTDLFVILFL